MAILITAPSTFGICKSKLRTQKKRSVNCPKSELARSDLKQRRPSKNQIVTGWMKPNENVRKSSSTRKNSRMLEISKIFVRISVRGCETKDAYEPVNNRAKQNPLKTMGMPTRSGKSARNAMKPSQVRKPQLLAISVKNCSTASASASLWKQ